MRYTIEFTKIESPEEKELRRREELFAKLDKERFIAAVKELNAPADKKEMFFVLLEEMIESHLGVGTFADERKVEIAADAFRVIQIQARENAALSASISISKRKTSAALASGRTKSSTNRTVAAHAKRKELDQAVVDYLKANPEHNNKQVIDYLKKHGFGSLNYKDDVLRKYVTASAKKWREEGKGIYWPYNS